MNASQNYGTELEKGCSVDRAPREERIVSNPKQHLYEYLRLLLFRDRDRFMGISLMRLFLWKR